MTIAARQSAAHQNACGLRAKNRRELRANLARSFILVLLAKALISHGFSHFSWFKIWLALVGFFIRLPFFATWHFCFEQLFAFRQDYSYRMYNITH